MFKILKEAAELTPVPFLKGAIGTALILLQTARVSLQSRCLGNMGTTLLSDNSVKLRGNAAVSCHGWRFCGVHS
jgi:hypothetical protein